MDVVGSRNRASVSKQAQFGVPMGRAPLLGTTRDMLGILFREPKDINPLKKERRPF
jgi:hypothetical protein